MVGRNFLTPGHPGVRVRNVRRKSRPKSLCLCCFSSLKCGRCGLKLSNYKCQQFSKECLCVFGELGSYNMDLCSLGHTPSTAGTFRKNFRKNSGKTPETLSERFLEFPSRVRLGCPKPYNSRHLRLPEHFQNSLPPSTAGGASFFRSGSGEGLSEPVMEFPAVLGVYLIFPGTLTTKAPCLNPRPAMKELKRSVKGTLPLI